MPNYEREMPEPDAEMKPIAGGIFMAWVPAVITVSPRADDPDPLDHQVVLHVDVVGARLVCTQCRVLMLPGGPSVTAEALRRVPISRYLREAVPNTHMVLEVDPERVNSTRTFERPAKDFADGGMSEDVLKEVARLYQWAMATGDAPLGLLERDYGVPRGKASRWISTARRRGLIQDDD